MWYPKVNPNLFEEELGSICRCDILLTGCEDGHLRKLINDHKHTIIFMLHGRQTKHAIHGYGFPWILGNRKRGV
jgi:hypothetical protein